MNIHTIHITAEEPPPEKKKLFSVCISACERLGSLLESVLIGSHALKPALLLQPLVQPWLDAPPPGPRSCGRGVERVLAPVLLFQVNWHWVVGQFLRE